MPAEPRWLTFDEVSELHETQLQAFGGSAGIRDPHLLHSALAAPQQQFACGSDDLLDVAVSLCTALARNHAFVDGNKRTAAVALIVFLDINGYAFEMPDDLSLGVLIEQLITKSINVGEFADALSPFVRSK